MGYCNLRVEQWHQNTFPNLIQFHSERLQFCRRYLILVLIKQLMVLLLVI